MVSPQRKKLLQLYALSGDKLVHLKDYSLPETAVLMVSNVKGKMGGGKRGESERREEREGRREERRGKGGGKRGESERREEREGRREESEGVREESEKRGEGRGEGRAEWVREGRRGAS